MDNQHLKRVVVLISGNGSNLQALIDVPNANYRICGVFSNRPEAAGLDRASKAGIENICLDHQTFDSRSDYDRALLSAISSWQPDLVVLAGYMRILAPEFVSEFFGRLVNIHPSLLPKYPGLHTHRKVLENQDLKHGSTVHFVSNELDAGPRIAQSSLTVSANDTEQTLADRVKGLEHKLYPEVVRWYAEDRLTIKGNVCYLDDQPLKEPILLE